MGIKLILNHKKYKWQDHTPQKPTWLTTTLTPRMSATQTCLKTSKSVTPPTSETSTSFTEMISKEDKILTTVSLTPAPVPKFSNLKSFSTWTHSRVNSLTCLIILPQLTNKLPLSPLTLPMFQAMSLPTLNHLDPKIQTHPMILAQP